jgi:hypothetical protein
MEDGSWKLGSFKDRSGEDEKIRRWENAKMRGDGIRKEGRKCKQGGKAFMPRGFKDRRGREDGRL